MDPTFEEERTLGARLERDFSPVFWKPLLLGFLPFQVYEALKMV